MFGSIFNTYHGAPIFTAQPQIYGFFYVKLGFLVLLLGFLELHL